MRLFNQVEKTKTKAETKAKTKEFPFQIKNDDHLKPGRCKLKNVLYYN